MSSTAPRIHSTPSILVYRTAPHRSAPHRTASHRIAPHRNASYRIAPRCAWESCSNNTCTVYFALRTNFAESQNLSNTGKHRTRWKITESCAKFARARLWRSIYLLLLVFITFGCYSRPEFTTNCLSLINSSRYLVTAWRQ